MLHCMEDADSDKHYTKNDLIDDLALMVKAGLLDVRMREDGEWLYTISDAAKDMSEEEREEAIRRAIQEEQ